MTTLAELVAASPAATSGVPTGFVYGAGEWRHVLELADPGTGSAVAWHDLTAVEGLFTGYDYNRGADGYQSRYRASTVALDFYAKDDALAPWNPDTSATFGTHMELGPGLLIRSGFIRVDGGSVVEWNCRFTNKVEFWGDASYSRGKVRQHRVTARDTMSSLVGVPLPARLAENWFERFVHLVADSGWPYGWVVYGARHLPGPEPVLLLPDRPASSSAINELDAILDPVGLVWYTNRLGQLVVRPRVNDTFHAAAFAAGADGTPWVEPPNVNFNWWACGDQPGEYEGTDHAAYAVDTPGIDPFGFDESDRWVINHVKVSHPEDPGFDDDDPVSIQRYDRKTLQASWMAPNDVVAGALLALRANATVEARPLNTNIRLKNFHPGPANIEFLDYLSIVHRNSDAGLEAFGNGWLRSYQEKVRPLGCDTDWSLALTVDIFAMSARATFLKPVEDLTLTGVTDTEASFTWTNPPQDIAPTHTQVRMINPASLWQTEGYPLDGFDWAGLAPTTEYEFQVRLIRVVDGITTHFSELRSLVFTTEEPAAPYVDPDTDDVHLPPADTGCVVEWEMQESATGTDPWTKVDEGTSTVDPFMLYEGVDYNLSDVTPGSWYRFIAQDVCSGIPQGWRYGTPNASDCVTGNFTVPPYDDDALIAYWPEVCPDGFYEATTHAPMIRGSSLKQVDVVDGVPVLVSASQGLIGYQVMASPPAGDEDLSISCRINLGSQPKTGSDPIVFSYGGIWMTIVADQTGPTPDEKGFRAIGHVRQGSDITTIESDVIHGLDTEWTLTLTHSQTGMGKLTLFVDGEEEATAIPGFGDRTIFDMAMHLPANSWITDAAAWDKVIMTTPLPVGARYKLGTSTPVAGGGAVVETVTEVDGHIVHTFTRTSTTVNGWSMTLVPIGAGPPGYVDFLIVGGGGSGGSANTGNGSAGGGGGGEVTEYLGQSAFVGPATTIVVGNGGGNGATGTDTLITRHGSSSPDYEAWGGAGGAVWAPGGASGHWASGAGASTNGYSSGTPGRGYNGRSGNSGLNFGGGGGGAGGPGTPVPPATSPRNGGPGKPSSMLTGALIFYGGGGGGGGSLGTGSNTGGLGGGGGTQTGGAANSGGGGGGAQNNFPVEAGGPGGYGAFILRYPGTLTIPMPVPTGLLAQWDADLAAETIDDQGTNLVNSWADSSGNGRTAGPGVMGSGTIGTNVSTLNGRNVLDFNGTRGLLVNTPFVYAAGAHTVMAVAKITSASGAVLICSEASTASTNPTWRFGALNQLVWHENSDNTGTTRYSRTSADVVDSGWHVHIGTDSGTNATVQADDVTPVSGAYTRAATTMSRFGIGGCPRATPDGYLYGQLAELLIWNRVLTAPEIADMKAYFSEKWNV